MLLAVGDRYENEIAAARRRRRLPLIAAGLKRPHTRR
jgi:hypothetical protein